MTPEQWWAHNDLDGLFESPHDAPLKWLCVLNPLHMYTAYLDETGQQTNDWVFVAGFLGNKEQWDCLVPRWKEAVGPQRKRVHMNELRWKRLCTKKLLARLGPIPEACGLKAVAGGVKYSDYEDLIEGTIVEKLSEGYLWSLFPLVLNILKYIPPDERVELIFGAQSIYKERALDLSSFMAKTTVEDPNSGLSKLAKWIFVPLESTILLDPSDYYAYALAQYHRDRTSQKTEWCMPILDAPHEMPYIGRILSRDEIRGQIIRGKQNLMQHGISLMPPDYAEGIKTSAKKFARSCDSI